MNANLTFPQAVEALQKRAAQTPGATKDLARCFKKGIYEFSESCFAVGVSKYAIDWEKVFTLPQKQIFRLVQMVNTLESGIVANFDYTHARILCAMKLAGEYDLCTDAVAALAAGAITPGANTRGVTMGAVKRMFKYAHKRSTVDTKVSNMTGRNGFSQVLGMTNAKPGATNHTIRLNNAHPMVTRFFEVIEGATDGQIAAANEKALSGKSE